jgi:hypothetical protein
MPRRLPKRPVYAVKSAEWKPVGADNDYVIEPAKWWPQISESQWVEIQTVYGSELVPDVRREILESTYRFAVLAQMESTGVPAADVTDEIERIRNTANTLFAALTAEAMRPYWRMSGLSKME